MHYVRIIILIVRKLYKIISRPFSSFNSSSKGVQRSTSSVDAFFFPSDGTKVAD